MERISIFCVRAGCEMPLVSYVSKHSSQFFPLSHVCVLICTHNLKTTGYIWTFSISINALLSDTFFVWFRVAKEIQLKSYGSRHASVII